MDPSAMDFMMHQDMHSHSHAGSPTSSSTMDHAARSACPALRTAAEQNQQSPMFPSRPNYRPDSSNPSSGFWQSMPHPYARWEHNDIHQANNMFSLGNMPPSMNAGQGSPPHYPSRGPEQYNPSMSPRSYYHTPIMSLTRIGGTAPTQHSQGNSSGSNQNQSPGGIRSGTTSGLSGPGNQSGHSGHSGQGGPGTLMINSGIPGRQNGLTNGRLPSMNSVPPPLTNNNLQNQTQTFSHNSRVAQQSDRNSPPHFIRHSSTPSAISLSMSEPNVPSPVGAGNELNSTQADTSSSSRRAPTAAASTARPTEMPNESFLPEPRRVNANRDRRGLTRLPSSESGWSSDDDSDTDAVAMSLLEAAVAGPHTEGGTEGRLRAQQVMRGSISTKRVASKKALTSLESVSVASLPENERTCVICYNDYGVETPEGISESPLRLPRCKHVFGDHCIKKWFEESDSCPYCRDRVPSEPQYRQAMNAHNVYRFLRQHHQMQMQMQTMRSGRDHDRNDSESGGRLDSMLNGFGSLASSPFEYEYGPTGSSPSRRADAMPMYSSRTPAWHGNSGERHSPLPFNETGENRRRVRPRHGSLRGFAPGRPHFTPTPANNAPQSQQQYSSWMHRTNTNQPHSLNRQHSVSGQNNNGRSSFDASVPAFPFQAAMSAHPLEPYSNPLNMSNVPLPRDGYTSPMRSHAAPISPTYPGPEVYMANADEPMYGGSVPHGQM